MFMTYHPWQTVSTLSPPIIHGEYRVEVGNDPWMEVRYGEESSRVYVGNVPAIVLARLQLAKMRDSNTQHPS